MHGSIGFIESIEACQPSEGEREAEEVEVIAEHAGV